MSYNTSEFLIFLFVFLSIYLLLPTSNLKRNWLLIGNIVFYVYAGVSAAIIVLATACVAYAITRRIEAIYLEFEECKTGLSPKEQMNVFAAYKRRTKKYLWLAFLLILGIWILIKMGRLFGMETVIHFSEMLSGQGIIVPLGISYYTLSVIGYILDVYWRKAKAEHNLLKLCTVILYFPHIVQGPISKYSGLFKQFDNLPSFDYTRVCFGIQLMLWGYIKKMVIADRLILYTNAVFSSPNDFAGIEILGAMILSVFQLYADFSGCMDIVRGVSQVIGIELAENFRQPLFAKTVQEFWSKWHITLGAWTKEYIYLPIAMNPKFIKHTNQIKKNGFPRKSSCVKAFCPLIAVWLFTGIWHGTGIDYIVWGLYYCLIMTVSKELEPLKNKISSRFNLKDKNDVDWWRTVRTFMLFAAGRMFTVTGSLTGCVVLWRQLLKEHRLWTLFDGSLYTHGLNQKNFYVAFVGILAIIVVDLLHEHNVSIRMYIANCSIVSRWLIYYLAFFIVLIFGMYGPGYDAASFVYGAF